ncbi:MAG: hypothetical protein Q8L57_03235, partial [bacterium]|nr:hypothetical protein [bacterium]
MKLRTIIIIIILILGYFLIVVKGWQPVAFVGWQPVFKNTFDEQVAAYQRAYEVGSAVFPEFKVGGKNSNVEPKKILEKIIREKILQTGVKTLKVNDLKKEINQNIINSLGQESPEKLEQSL